jgi:hypothetical protein
VQDTNELTESDRGETGRFTVKAGDYLFAPPFFKLSAGIGTTIGSAVKVLELFGMGGR